MARYARKNTNLVENLNNTINEIKMNDNREIFEVPGVYENPRRQTLTLALTVYVKCLKDMKLMEFDTKFTNEQYFVVNFPELILIPELWIN